MRVNFRYGAAAGILAAAFTTLAPLAAQACVTPGIPLVPTCSGSCGIGVAAAHFSTTLDTSIVVRKDQSDQAWLVHGGLGWDRNNCHCQTHNFRLFDNFRHSSKCVHVGGLVNFSHSSELNSSAHFSSVTSGSIVKGF